MIKSIGIILCIPINCALAGELPSSLFKIEIGKSIHEIENANKSRMKGLYSIPVDEKQLFEPLSRLLVKVDKHNGRINQVFAEGVVSDALCASESEKLKEKYEKLFSMQFEISEHKGDTLYTITKDNKYFMIGCKSRKSKTLLRVSLADMSKELIKRDKQKTTHVPKKNSSPRKLVSAWSTNCENIDNSRWFALESHGDKQYMFVFCAGFKCIPLPGFGRKLFDVYNDKRIKWISETEMKLSNKHKYAGWEGDITFDRCREY